MSITVMSDLIGEYLAHLRRCGRSQNTIELRRSVLYRVSEDLAVGLDYDNDGLDHATAEELAEWLSNWTGQTRAAYHSSLAGYYEWAVKTGHLDWSPMDEVPRARVGRRLPKPVPRERLVEIFRVSREPFRFWFRLGVYGGLRCCEIARLNAEDIGEDEIRLLGKGDKARVLPTHPVIWEAAQSLPPGPVAAVDGRRRTAAGISRSAREHLDRIGHPDVTMHRLRHSFATMTLEETGDVMTLSELMGHSSVSTTQIYTLVTSARRKAAVLALPDLVAG